MTYNDVRDIIEDVRKKVGPANKLKTCMQNVGRIRRPGSIQMTLSSTKTSPYVGIGKRSFVRTRQLTMPGGLLNVK